MQKKNNQVRGTYEPETAEGGLQKDTCVVKSQENIA